MHSRTGICTKVLRFFFGGVRGLYDNDQYFYCREVFYTFNYGTVSLSL